LKFIPLLIAAVACAPAHALGGRLLGTGGATQFEGAAGGGIVPWAVIAGSSHRARGDRRDVVTSRTDHPDPATRRPSAASAEPRPLLGGPATAKTGPSSMASIQAQSPERVSTPTGNGLRTWAGASSAPSGDCSHGCGHGTSA